MKIILKNDLKVGNRYGGIEYLEIMNKGRGKLLEVLHIDYDDDTMQVVFPTELEDELSVGLWVSVSMIDKVVPDSKVYIAGDMLTKGSQLLRALEREDIENLGYEVYNPKDNEDINDKQAQGNSEDLAERIVLQDTNALFDCDTIVIEPQPYAMGTMVELGQLKGMKDTSTEILKIIAGGGDIEEIVDYCTSITQKRVLPHYEDIRRIDEPEIGDRRSLGINAYVYGTCLDLSNGKGFYEWDEILEILGGRY